MKVGLYRLIVLRVVCRLVVMCSVLLILIYCLSLMNDGSVWIVCYVKFCCSMLLCDDSSSMCL